MKNIDIVIPCYNPGQILENTLTSILNQEIGDNWKFNIIVVDDASTDDSFNNLSHEFYSSIQIVKLKENGGRSVARNMGADSGTGDYIVFLDCDCEMESPRTLQILLEDFKNDNDVIYGSVKSKGNGFWIKYFNSVSIKREKIAMSKSLLGFSSQYFTITRKAFEKCNGFNIDYSSYGFEDRDLILRLENQKSKIKFNRNSIVYHEEVASLDSIAMKLMEAGQYTSMIFEKSHPEIYRKMIYGKIDARIHPIKMLPIIKLVIPFLGLFVRSGTSIINQIYIPYHIKAIYVKLVSALAYIKGTSVAIKPS